MAITKELPIGVTKKDSRYYKKCPSCDIEISYLRKNYAVESFRLKKICKPCANKKTENCHRGWHRGIRISWFNKFKLQAELRGISFDITINDIADLYESQNKKCALTNWSIEFPNFGHGKNTAIASIDRIDSSQGYTRTNVQLLHKDVNMAKQQYSQEYFISMCKSVADKVKW
jgi:hypothetical protein